MSICLFAVVLGLHCSAGFSLVAVSGDCALGVVCGLLIAAAALVAGHWLQGTGLQQLWHIQSTGSVDVVHGRSCPAACGIFLDQGSNPCLLHWPVDSLPLSCQESSGYIFECHYCGDTTGIQWVEVRNSPIHSSMHRKYPATKNFLAQNVVNAKAEKDCPRGILSSVTSQLNRAETDSVRYNYSLFCDSLSLAQLPRQCQW